MVGSQKRPVHGPPPTAAGRFGPSNSDFSSPHRFRMSLRSLGQSSGRALLGHKSHPSLESDIITLHPWPMVGTHNFYGILLIFFVRTPLRNSCPFSPAATSCNHGDRTLIHCPLSTCPSAPWPDLVPSLLVGPPDHAQRVGAIPVDAVSTWLDHFPRCPEEPIDWCAHHRLDLWASEYVGSGSEFIG